ncbi:MAG: methyl-accepting chemotaxis protein [Bacillaceae bacterium]|nr:methyl-accepting chemotaxis protein [Bacillaceae bacterium]
MKTIRGRVRFILATAIAGLVIVLLCNFLFYFIQSNAKQQEVTLLETVNGSKEIKFSFAETRRFEQEFLRQPTDGTAEKIKVTAESIIEMSKGLSTNFNDQEEISGQFQQIERATNTYIAEFEELENLYREIGFSEFQGLRGDITSLARNLTANTRGLNDSEMDELLTNIRLYEQQYLTLRHDTIFRDFTNAANNFRQMLTEGEYSESSVATILRLFDPYVQSMNTIQDNYMQSTRLIRNFEQISTTVELSVSRVEESVSTLQQDIQAELNGTLQTTMLATVILSVIILLFLTIIGYFLNRNIYRSIKSLKEGATKIGEGNFAHRVPITTKDEMAELGETFNKMAEKMQTSLIKVMEATDMLHSSSQNLAAISEETTAQSTEVNEAIKQVAIGSSDQAKHLEESNDILQHVQVAINETMKLTLEIKKKADQAHLQGEDGLEIVEELKASSSKFLQLANHLTVQVQTATNQSQQINSIVGTIQEIAENTDLLALNAAIESARAGEAGRGFAVVAQEVRKLAERSKAEALTIKKLVSTMGAQMKKLSQEAEQFNEYRNLQEKSVEATQQSFVSIASNVKEIHGKVEEVEQSMNAVHVANNSLSEKLSEVQYISEEAAATSEQVSASSEHQIVAIEQVNYAAISLTDIANELQDEVSQFIVKEDAINNSEYIDITNDELVTDEELSEEENHYEVMTNEEPLEHHVEVQHDTQEQK